MFTSTEKKYLALTAAFLAAGAGLKAYRRASVAIGPLPSLEISAEPDSGRAAEDSAAPPPRADSAAGAVPREERPPAGKVRINHAGAAELVGVRGIGEKTARAILDYRRAHGPFRSLEELLNVKGIGPKKLATMRPQLAL